MRRHWEPGDIVMAFDEASGLDVEIGKVARILEDGCADVELYPEFQKANGKRLILPSAPLWMEP